MNECEIHADFLFRPEKCRLAQIKVGRTLPTFRSHESVRKTSRTRVCARMETDDDDVSASLDDPLFPNVRALAQNVFTRGD